MAIVSDGLNLVEAEEGVRRLRKGGTGVRQDRKPINADVVTMPDRSFGIRVKPYEEAQARLILREEGWPTL